MTRVWDITYQVMELAWVDWPYGSGRYLYPGTDYSLSLVGMDESQVRNKFEAEYAFSLGKAFIISI